MVNLVVVCNCSSFKASKLAFVSFILYNISFLNFSVAWIFSLSFSLTSFILSFFSFSNYSDKFFKSSLSLSWMVLKWLMLSICSSRFLLSFSSSLTSDKCSWLSSSRSCSIIGLFITVKLNYYIFPPTL